MNLQAITAIFDGAERDGRDVLLETEGLQLLDALGLPAPAHLFVEGVRGGRRRPARAAARPEGRRQGHLAAHPPQERRGRRRHRGQDRRGRDGGDLAHGRIAGHAGCRRVHDQRVRPLLAGARARAARRPQVDRRRRAGGDRRRGGHLHRVPGEGVPSRPGRGAVLAVAVRRRSRRRGPRAASRSCNWPRGRCAGRRRCCRSAGSPISPPRSWISGARSAGASASSRSTRSSSPTTAASWPSTSC